MTGTRNNKTKIWIWVAVLAAMIAGTGGLIVQWNQKTPEQIMAEQDLENAQRLQRQTERLLKKIDRGVDGQKIGK